MLGSSRKANCATAANTNWYPLNPVVQGSGVENCTGTTIYCKSLYIQGEISINANLPQITVGNVYGVAAGGNKENQGVAGSCLLTASKAANVRVVVLLDKAPNSTNATIADVYKIAPVPCNIKNFNTLDAGATATPTLALDPDKTRRFKILYNEVFTVTMDTPLVHYEKYIPLNFYTVLTGNDRIPDGSNGHQLLVTNGIYFLAFTSPADTTADPDLYTPFITMVSKLRFEP